MGLQVADYRFLVLGGKMAGENGANPDGPIFLFPLDESRRAILREIGLVVINR